MTSFVIEGGRPLRGAIRPIGNKNAALPMLAACLLTDAPVTLHNLPRIGDVHTMMRILRGMGVDTFVLGIPGPASALQQMAIAGGRARNGTFYEANNTAQLEQALREITAAVAECQYDLPSPPDPVRDPSLLRITFDGVTVAPGGNGWVFIDSSNRSIRFQGAACTTLRAGNVRRITALYNCR